MEFKISNPWKFWNKSFQEYANNGQKNTKMVPFWALLVQVLLYVKCDCPQYVAHLVLSLTYGV